MGTTELTAEPPLKVFRKKWYLIMLVLTGALVTFLFWPDGNRTYRVGPPVRPGGVQPTLAVDFDSATFLAPDGTLWIWGGSQFHLRNLRPKPTTIETPQQIGGDSNWARMSGTDGHIVAIKSDGSLWTWGNNGSGELTSAHRPIETTPVRVGTDNDWQDVSAGAGHVMALKRDGSLWLWGQNNAGQIGNGTTNNVRAPFRIPQPHRWRAIAAGSFNSYAIADDGSLWGWGLSGTFGSGTSPDDLRPTNLAASSEWSAIAAGSFHLLALRKDGTLWTRGQNASTIAPNSIRSPTAKLVQLGSDADWQRLIATGNAFLARKADGSWWRGGYLPWKDGWKGLVNRGPRPDLAPMEADFNPWAVGGGGNTTIVLNHDGRLWTAGQRLGCASQFVAIRRMIGTVVHALGGRYADGFVPKMDLHPYLVRNFGEQFDRASKRLSDAP